MRNPLLRQLGSLLRLYTPHVLPLYCVLSAVCLGILGHVNTKAKRMEVCEQPAVETGARARNGSWSR
jgi:hypothetical protein